MHLNCRTTSPQSVAFGANALDCASTELENFGVEGPDMRDDSPHFRSGLHPGLDHPLQPLEASRPRSVGRIEVHARRLGHHAMMQVFGRQEQSRGPFLERAGFFRRDG